MANVPPTSGGSPGLRGRIGEAALLDGILVAVREAQSRTLLLRGDAGIGKTALLEQMIENAPDLRVLRAVGVESEMELAFASLHQLCAPMLDRAARLPAPQRTALETVFGFDVGSPPDPLLVGLAVLGLVSEVAGDRPLLCIVDDAQWLDRASAQTLAFVARRLFAEPVALVFAAREPADELRDLPELEVGGLREGDARALLKSSLPFLLDDEVRDQIVAETRGNPLALLELPRGLTATQLAGFGLLNERALSGQIEESFRRRLENVSEPTRALLLIAAAETVGDPVLLWRAAEGLATGSASVVAGESEGLLSIGGRVAFRHPLVRSAVYRFASPSERRAAHQALADATDPQADPDRRARRRAPAPPRPRA